MSAGSRVGICLLAYVQTAGVEDNPTDRIAVRPAWRKAFAGHGPVGGQIAPYARKRR
ncbi:MAG: hypothetical protein AAGF44_04515 [Pseudomonadota bacterium]